MPSQALDLWLEMMLVMFSGGNPDSNTLISETATVVCLDDYHSLDRFGRKETGLTALDPKAQDFDTMYEQTQAIKDGKPIDKLIYNHVTGLLDPPETIKPPKVMLVQMTVRPCISTGLHDRGTQNCTDMRSII